ncbi:MAG TPA: PAS domain S-box protein [Cytophagaceae bacterium]|nr:PAS domain S-box protein [Cytophagaceae bacterium]
MQERIHNLELQFSQREEELTSSEEELRQSFESQGKMMEEIQLKEISLSALINNTTDFIYSLDTKFCLVEFNDSVKDFYSKLGIELTKGKSAYDFISQKNIHEAIKVFNKVLEGHSEIAVIEAKDAKGNIVYFESSYNPIRNEKKENIGISVMIREITERIKSERKIKTSEEKFSKAFRSSPDSALITTVQELRILECNDGFLAFSGYTREEVEAKTMIELGFWDLEERNKLKEILLTNGEVIEMEVHLKIKSGAIRTCLISAEALELNNELCMISMTRDITEKKLAEENIRKKNNELLELTNLMVDYKLMALRSAMNPHFLFNVMNSIQYFIAKNEKENALKYLAVFSKLIRNILTSSIENKTSLKHEIETLSNYIELEILRFEKKFSVQYEIDESIDLNAIEIPSLLLQPYVENAILHGLHNKTNGNGLLKIQIKMQEENLLKFIIEDNGVGREESAKIKLESQLDHKSVGMRLTKERLDIINRRNNITVEVIDLFNENNEASGTRIQIFIEC